MERATAGVICGSWRRGEPEGGIACINDCEV